MNFDFGKIKAKKIESGPVDPIEIFQKNKSKITDTVINDLWLGQGDALRDWHANRDKDDVAIVLNTGAGKTLIGLLIAQSLVNETKGKVIYACASIQLIEQTREKAEGYGLKVTTYYEREFSNDLFHKGEAVCLTTYQAIFNGKSKFRNEELAAVVFDDAHAAEGLIKDHFSLHIDRSEKSNLFNALIELFRHYYQSVGRIGSFNELLSGENSNVELLPPFEVIRNFSEIQRYINESKLSSDINNMFAWEYLKDHLDLCAYLVSSRSIQIIPPVIPVSNLTYFQRGIRRVYLSATMLVRDSFIRTFGQELDYVVKPDTPAGQCERLIIFPEQVYGVEDDRVTTKEFISDRKALILAPSKFIAEQWKDIGKIPNRENMIELLDVFKRSSGTEKLILAARYDGIDLPGDTCRHLILDGLPTGTGLLDKYMWESLRLSNILRSTIACRIVQSLGRISRGMSDYGVVIFIGREYIKWLLTPRNQAYLPPFIQKQIKLGLQTSENCKSCDDITSAANACLSRDSGWIDAYEQYLDECETEEVETSDEILIDLAASENKFIKKYWDRDYCEAIKILESILEKAFSFSPSIGSWYALWIGYCFDLSGDRETAPIYYKRANGATKNIPKFVDDGTDLTITPTSIQISNIANEFLINQNASVSIPKKLHINLQALNGKGTVKQTEEAIRWLGQYLGLDATRPDNEHGTGPDVLWFCDSVALVVEAKTDKESEYKKDEVGQLSDHMQWVENNFPGIQKIPVFIGPSFAATKTTNPSEEVVVIELSELQDFSQRLIAAYEDIVKRAVPLNLIQVIEEVFKERNLIWPNLLNHLNKRKLTEL
jgi:tetratricopeptide (TPR) repeat protein